MDQLQISFGPYNEMETNSEYDLDRIIFDLDSQIELLSSQADKLDYLVSIASGLLCGCLDVLWVGEFNLERGRDIASDKVEGFVKGTAKRFGCKKDDLQSSVKFLEDMFPIPSDGNTPDFGGGRQHHLRDFAHHPTLVGLLFSLLTQFTNKSYGTDEYGIFKVVNVSKESEIFIGKDVPTKILYGTITWFFHLVSDVAGSSSTAGKSGGTGIPGPILALAKELSALPFFRNMKVGDNSLPVFLSKLFNGTLLAKHDESGTIIGDSVFKMDLRGELGIGIELGCQAIPVAANECIVRAFYFLRRFAIEMQDNDVHSLEDMKRISWEKVKPANNPTIDRMLMIAAGVFMTVDAGEAIISGKYLVSVNFVGIGRFAVAVGQDVAWSLKVRPIKKIKKMYEKIKRFTYTRENEKFYDFGLTLEQIEILYNLEYYKTQNDIQCTKLPINTAEAKQLKQEWLDEWQKYITEGFPYFLQVSNAQLHWYSEYELLLKIVDNDPKGTWFRLVLLEAMVFEPYYPLEPEKNKNGNDVLSKKYIGLQNPVAGYKKGDSDAYLDEFFAKRFYAAGYIKRLRKCYDKVLIELNEVLKTAITSISITAAIAAATIATAGTFAPGIAVALVGSNFAGLSGAALTSTSLAYLGGGAIAAGGLGMAGGTMAIVGGGAALGLGAGAGVGGAVGTAGLAGKKSTILQSAKLLVSVREIFLNDEHDLECSKSIYNKYIQNKDEIQNDLVELRSKVFSDFLVGNASAEEKKQLKAKIKKAEETAEVIKIAQKIMEKFISSFETGVAQGS